MPLRCHVIAIDPLDVGCSVAALSMDRGRCRGLWRAYGSLRKYRTIENNVSTEVDVLTTFQDYTLQLCMFIRFGSLLFLFQMLLCECSVAWLLCLGGRLGLFFISVCIPFNSRKCIYRYVGLYFFPFSTLPQNKCGDYCPIIVQRQMIRLIWQLAPKTFRLKLACVYLYTDVYISAPSPTWTTL